MKCILFTVLLLAELYSGWSLQGLSPEQEAWLESVSYGNRSTDWPPLSSNQSSYLLSNVLLFQQLTETANYPYHQAVEVWYSDKNRSKIVAYDDVGDGAAWTGLHLAALVHEYRATNDPLTMERLWDTLEALDNMTACTGKLGYIPRFVGLATDPTYAKYYVGYSNGAYECIAPYEEYIWLGYSSRDMYFGVAFGLANAWVWLGSNATIQSKTQMLVERIVDCLKDDHFWVISPKKQFVNPDPIFSATWRKLALAVNHNKYKDMEAAYIGDFILAYASEMTLGSKVSGSYYPNELMVEAMYSLSILEDEETVKEKLLKKFRQVAVDNADHVQPGFAAFFLSAFPNTTDYKIPQGVLQGGLYDYPSAPDWDHYVDQSSNGKYMPHHDSEHSNFALMIRDRPPRTYLWQRAPTLLKGGEVACCFQRKHLDLILAYWMGRTSGFIKQHSV